ncbi:methylated-DNA--[protein]-cysteine S-methyltransferase [Nitrospirillum iridis]|uniref:Methylated-DNA--protein-cysteine methyltransferase n=1 Tax=Nitrospirillum iridis TaxID=765888 RepID=A0A7X0AYT3_9PROT|nr:methylated-DNA--[protein]-cysteine S-methyltransferase [Nitrospirillum iridis]MBB6251049.1 methylated-DNA-[protein]-cysteine S-methyltransferase [Nitrospirillum iridis]
MSRDTTYAFKHLPSPVGRLTLVASAEGLAAILWENERPGRVKLPPLTAAVDHPVLVETEWQLAAYFRGALQTFTVPLAFIGTDFQKQVWRALLTIPYGAVRSYSDIAHQIGRPTAARAVGAANGRNPISIIAPCHRVVGGNGSLTGFAGGLAAKEYLLGLEGGLPHPTASRRPSNGD